MTVYLQQTNEHMQGTIRHTNTLANTTLGQNSVWHQTIPDWNGILSRHRIKTVAANGHGAL